MSEDACLMLLFFAIIIALVMLLDRIGGERMGDNPFERIDS
jgi:hypothetical protein